MLDKVLESRQEHGNYGYTLHTIPRVTGFIPQAEDTTGKNKPGEDYLK